MIRPPVRSIIHELKLVDYLSVQVDKPCSICHLDNFKTYYKKIGYNKDVLRQTACLVVYPIKVNSFAYLLNCMTVC